MFPAFMNDYLIAGDTAFGISFYLAAAFTVLCAIKAVKASEARAWAVYFSLSMLGLACVYALLNSVFTAEVQIIIMVIGATALLCQAFYQCRDLPRLSGASASSAPLLNGGAALLMLAVLFFLLKSSSYFQDYKLYAPENSGHRGYYSESADTPDNLSSAYAVSKRFLTAYCFPLEITAAFIFIIAMAMSVCRQYRLPNASFEEIWQFLKAPLPAEAQSAAVLTEARAEGEPNEAAGNLK